MAYVITNSRGDVIATVESGEDNTSATSITLLGPNYPAYGLPQNENFVYMLENFASNTAPSNPIAGQLWFDTSTNTLYQRNTSANWTGLANNDYVQAQKISPVFTGNPTAPTASVNNISSSIATTAFVSNYIDFVNPAPLNSPFFTGTPLAPTAGNGTANNQIATTLFVTNLFNNVDVSPYAVKNNTVLTGLTSAPTPVLASRDSQIATTSFVRNVFENPDFSPYAPKANPVFTGIPQVPTASAATSTNQIASTAFVQGLFANVDLSIYAPKISPSFTGTPTAPTQVSTDSSTLLATTAFVQAQKTSPAFTGTPTAPTAASGTNNTQIATTAFVQTAVAGVAPAASVGAELAGSIKMWGSASPPSNWAICNGQALSRTAYPTLFSRIGTTFGAGDGSTTFNLPNYTDKFPVGAGGIYSAGSTGGYADAAVVTHTHPTSASSTATDAGHFHYTFVRATPLTDSPGVFNANTYPNQSATWTFDTTGRHSMTIGGMNGRTVGDTTYGNFPSANIAATSYSQGTTSVNTTVNVSAPNGAVNGTGRNIPPYQAAFWIIKLSDDGTGGGTLQAGTGIDLNTSGAYTTITNSGVTSINGQSGAVVIPTSTNLIAGQGISLSTVAGNTTITNTQALSPVIAGNGVTVTNSPGGAIVSANVANIQAGTGVTVTNLNGLYTISSASLSSPNIVWNQNSGQLSIDLALPEGTWVVTANFCNHEAAFAQQTLLIDSVVVQTLPNNGDPTGTSYRPMMGMKQVSGGRTITCSVNGVANEYSNLDSRRFVVRADRLI